MLLGYTERGPATANPPQPVLNSTIAARKAGFHDCIDTEDMFRELFATMRREKKLP
ncbi:MAG: hypothetical protein U5Q44_01215 [Dehalococcoidia bacterium]|nr:hypothetical protein [Dehalococcoidia bacterium]